MKESFIDVVFNGIQTFGDFINWPYLIVFIMVVWLLNNVTGKLPKKTYKHQVFNFTFLRTLGIGVLLAVIFYSLSDYYERSEILRYLVSLLFAMFIIYDGLRKWIDYFEHKIRRKKE
jgi:hypothetical protein